MSIRGDIDEPRAIAQWRAANGPNIVYGLGAAPQSVINGARGQSALAVEFRLDAIGKEAPP